MIKVTVELIPYGIGPAETIATATISNDGFKSRETGGERGDYRFELRGKRSWSRMGSVRDFPRKRKNIWYLIAKCLNEAGVK